MSGNGEFVELTDEQIRARLAESAAVLDAHCPDCGCVERLAAESTLESLEWLAGVGEQP